MPITEVGTHEKVAALIYLSATQPDNGECAAEALERQNAPMKGLSPDANGEIFLPAEAFADVMANDLPAKQSRVLAALQTPMNAATFGDKIGTAAWHEKPSFYLITKNYHALAHEVQQRFVKQINAKTKELDSGHLSMIAKPKELANWLIEIANLVNFYKTSHLKLVA